MQRRGESGQPVKRQRQKRLKAAKAPTAHLYKGFNPWDRISEPESLRALLLSTGAEMPDVVRENRRHRLRSPEDWWPMVLGTGYRGTIEQLDAAQRESVKTLRRICPHQWCGISRG